MRGLALQVAGRLLNRVRVNRVEAATRDGRPVLVKRRRRGAPIVVWLENLFFALTHSGTRMCARVGEWTQWEVHCGRLLYPDQPPVTVGPGPVVTLPRVEGTSLRTLVYRGDPEVRHALVLAAGELRRVHGIYCNRYRAAWSHGDLHLDNILCDVSRNRAVLIDFDIRHEFTMDSVHRQADDVLMVLLELLGLPDERWQEWAAAFAWAYGGGPVLSEVSRCLVPPTGLRTVLWSIRTHGAPMQRLEPRLAVLQRIIQTLVHPCPP